MGQVERYSFIPEHQTDSEYGGSTGIHPCGWKKIALKNKWHCGDDTWFGENEKQPLNGRWAISYHGPKNHNTITAIINNGYDVDKNERAAFGKGIYSSPNPATAEGYAETFVYNGKRIRTLVMNRVHMNHTQVVNNGQYFVTANDRMIRPIAVLVKEV